MRLRLTAIAILSLLFIAGIPIAYAGAPVQDVAASQGSGASLSVTLASTTVGNTVAVWYMADSNACAADASGGGVSLFNSLGMNGANVLFVQLGFSFWSLSYGVVTAAGTTVTVSCGGHNIFYVEAVEVTGAITPLDTPVHRGAATCAFPCAGGFTMATTSSLTPSQSSVFITAFGDMSGSGAGCVVAPWTVGAPNTGFTQGALTGKTSSVNGGTACNDEAVSEVASAYGSGATTGSRAMSGFGTATVQWGVFIADFASASSGGGNTGDSPPNYLWLMAVPVLILTALVVKRRI